MIRKVEKLCKEAVERSPHLLVPWYLMTSYLYYVEDQSVISDKMFDNICRRLLSEWDTIDHPHKNLVSKESLIAGTGFNITAGQYPLMTKSAALRLLRIP